MAAVPLCMLLHRKHMRCGTDRHATSYLYSVVLPLFVGVFLVAVFAFLYVFCRSTDPEFQESAAVCLLSLYIETRQTSSHGQAFTVQRLQRYGLRGITWLPHVSVTESVERPTLKKFMLCCTGVIMAR